MREECRWTTRARSCSRSGNCMVEPVCVSGVTPCLAISCLARREVVTAGNRVQEQPF